MCMDKPTSLSVNMSLYHVTIISYNAMQDILILMPVNKQQQLDICHDTEDTLYHNHFQTEKFRRYEAL